MKSFAFRKNSFTILVTHNHLNNNNLKGQTLNIETMRHNQCGICFSFVNGKGFFFFWKGFRFHPYFHICDIKYYSLVARACRGLALIGYLLLLAAPRLVFYFVDLFGMRNSHKLHLI